MDTSTNYRLPRNIVPKRYSIRLRPDFQAFTFAGAESIELEVMEASTFVTMNAAELEIKSARVVQAENSQNCHVELDAELERVTLSFDLALAPGNAVLDIEFMGSLNDQLSGFYRSKFVGENGEELYIATTQFEATDARKAFPCFDEPDLKAVFSVQLDAPLNYLAVSNAPESGSVDLGDGYKRVSFEDTIPMSTYLLAFIVTRSPNHICAISWLITSTMRSSSSRDDLAGSTRSSVSLKVTAPRFSMAPNAKSGMAIRSSFLPG